MMKKIFYILSVACILSSSACEDGYNDRVDLADTDYFTNDPKYPPTELDNWLLETFTYPYNIEVKYRWDASEGDLYRTLVPPKVSQIQPVMDVVKKVWIEPYAALAGGSFIRAYCPKQFLLVGSAHYNLDGTVTLGTAEGGRKVVLYVVNEFLPSNRGALQSMMHIVHHEFGHILNQKVAYPASFREITTAGYTSDWRFTPVGQARANGFITSYAMASPHEDFVEMVATMLMEGKAGYEAILDCQTTAWSRELLKKKEELVVQYFRDAFNVDFYGLQTAVQEAMDALALPDDGPEPPPPLHESWGFEKENTALRFDLSRYGQPFEFSGRFYQDRNNMYTKGYSLDPNFKLFYTSETELTLRVYYYDVTDDTRVYQQANYYFSKEAGIDGSFMIWFNDSDENGKFLVDDLGAGALPGYFGGRSFKANWLPTCDGSLFASLIPQDDPENFCYGTLEN
jgi:substrate import-associated zinc metallohydrolase lipoprotein